MNLLFYLEPLITENNPYLYCGWLPLWSRLIQALDKNTGTEFCYKLITAQAIYTVIDQFNMPDKLDIIPIPIEKLIDQFNFSSADASLAWFKRTYTDEQIKYTAQLFTDELENWEPDVIITSSEIPFLEKNYPDAAILHFEGGVTTRPPFPPSWYLDPMGSYRYSLLARKWDEINKAPIYPPEKKLLERYRSFFLALIRSKNPFKQFIQSYQGKFDHIILVPLQTDTVWFTGNCEFATQFQLVHKILSTLDPKIGVLVTTHPSNPWISNDIEQYFRYKFPNFIFSPEIQTVNSSSQYLLDSIDAVLSVSSMVGLQTLIWKKKLFAVGETQLKVAADYCFASDLGDIHKLPELLKKPNVDRDNVLFWILTKFHIHEHYFFDPDWLLNYISRMIQAKRMGNMSLDLFTPVDESVSVLQHIFEGAILDIPRYRDRESESLTGTFEEKLLELQNIYECLNVMPQDNFWQTLISRNYDEPVQFSDNNKNAGLLISGWSQMEGWGVWSQGPVVDIVISLPPNSGKDIIMQGDWLGFVNDRHPIQIIDVMVNDEKLGYLSFEHGVGFTTDTFTIPPSVFATSPSQTHIRLIINSPASPASLGLSTDTRQLGIGLRSLKFSLSD